MASRFSDGANAVRLKMSLSMTANCFCQSPCESRMGFMALRKIDCCRSAMPEMAAKLPKRGLGQYELGEVDLR